MPQFLDPSNLPTPNHTHASCHVVLSCPLQKHTALPALIKYLCPSSRLACSRLLRLPDLVASTRQLAQTTYESLARTADCERLSAVLSRQWQDRPPSDTPPPAARLVVPARGSGQLPAAAPGSARHAAPTRYTHRHSAQHTKDNMRIQSRQRA